MVRNIIATAVLSATLGVALLAAPAQAQDRVKVGVLNCDVSGGIGLIIGSQKTMSCRFTPSAPDLPVETYTGSISKFGLDIGATSGGRIVWTVFAPTAHPDSLAGTYVGASAEATIAAGLGANVLVGGSGNTFALQPVSVQTQTGLNLAVGVTELRLQRAG